MSPAGGQCGRIASKFLTRIAVFSEQHGLRHTFAAETGFTLETNPDTVRAPYVAFISTVTLGDLLDHGDYLPVVPEWVAEVVSLNDRSSDVEEKTNGWLEAGVQVVLVVDLQTQSVRRYASGQDIHFG